MDERTLNKLTESLDDGLNFVKSMLNNFDNGALSKIYPHLTEEERRKILDKKTELKSISEDLSATLTKTGVYGLDSKELSDLKERIDKIKE